jgi:hypothetical protein
MCGGKEKVDGITFMTEQIAELNKEVEALQAKGVNAEEHRIQSMRFSTKSIVVKRSSGPKESPKTTPKF